MDSWFCAGEGKSDEAPLQGACSLAPMHVSISISISVSISSDSSFRTSRRSVSCHVLDSGSVQGIGMQKQTKPLTIHMSCSIPSGSPAPSAMTRSAAAAVDACGQGCRYLPTPATCVERHISFADANRPWDAVRFQSKRSGHTLWLTRWCHVGPVPLPRNSGTGPGPENTYAVTQKRDEHASERAWNGNVPLKLTRLTKRDDGRKPGTSRWRVWTGDGQGLGQRQNNLDLPVCTEE